MARALFQAGARSVVRCAWGAPTTAADRYVLALYESLAEGTPIGGAVRAAKLRLMKDGLGPSAWGAFDLVGDGRLRLPLQRPGHLAALVAGWRRRVAAWLIWLTERRHRRPSTGGYRLTQVCRPVAAYIPADVQARSPHRRCRSRRTLGRMAPGGRRP